jgi:hypothetical protein
MEFKDLAKLIFNEIKPKLENSQGLSIFAKERAKFEGWLKVELCDSLSKYFKDVAPERNCYPCRIDVTFENWAIELKTVNTNIRYKNVKNKHRPITRNTKGVIDDIEKLKSTGYTNRGVLFVVFPITHSNRNWQVQLQRIFKLLREIKHINFNFKDEIPGVVYFGSI